MISGSAEGYKGNNTQERNTQLIISIHKERKGKERKRTIMETDKSKFMGE